MNSSQSKYLVLFALALAVFVYFHETGDNGTQGKSSLQQKVLPLFRPADITRIEFTRTNLTLRADRTNGAWALTAPLPYPAQTTPIEGLLDACARLKPLQHIEPKQISNLNDFGLAPPQAVVRAQFGTNTVELRVGSRAPVGNQLYVQADGEPGIAIVDASLLGLLPADANDWRDRTLLNVAGINYDRLRARFGTREIVFQHDPTNKIWRITSPAPPKRADGPRVAKLLQDLQKWEVQQFVTDDARADLDAFGLTTPEAEIAFASGTNDVVVVQFGKNPTNDMNTVFARRTTHTNVVLVPRLLLDELRAPYWDWSDHHLMDSVSAAGFDQIETRGPDSFIARRGSNDTWRLVSPVNLPADPDAIRTLLIRFSELESVELAKEVVTDFKTFGLDPPARRFTLSLNTTNAAGAPTNAVVAQVDLSAPDVDDATKQRDGLYARRADENFAYIVTRFDVARIPAAFWQVRDRQVWNFASNQVQGVKITFQGRERKLARIAAKQWTADGKPVEAATGAALDEAMQRLGSLQTERWIARGELELVRYNFVPGAHKINVELNVDGKPQTNSLAFGPTTPRGPLATVYLDGRPVVFLFPAQLYVEFVQHYFTVPEP